MLGMTVAGSALCRTTYNSARSTALALPLSDFSSFIVAARQGINRANDPSFFSCSGVPITYYTLTLPSSTSSSNLIVTISSVASHEAEPRPASLPQRADSLLLISNIDLSASLDGLSADERVTVKDVKIKVKAPSPRIGEVRAPKSGAWDMSHTKGGATITFTSKASVSEMVGEQVGARRLTRRSAGSLTALWRLRRLRLCITLNRRQWLPSALLTALSRSVIGARPWQYKIRSICRTSVHCKCARSVIWYSLR